MLTARASPTLALISVVLAAAVTLLVGLLNVVWAGPAEADDPVICPANMIDCIVQVKVPPAASAEPARAVAGRTGHETGACRVANGESVPCQDPQFGSFSNADGCYYQRLAEQPPSSDPVWEGHYPQGAIYAVTCPGTAGTGGGWTWRGTPPGGGGTPQVTPAQLAQQVVRRLGLRGAAIGTAPPPGVVGLVHAPVWLWTSVSATTWGPVSETASVPGLSVTATARATRIVWQMGDGNSVTCTGPGTPYRASFGAVASPTCGHVYERASTGLPGGAFTVTATTTWEVAWTGGGQSGTLTTTRTSTSRLRIGELQVVT